MRSDLAPVIRLGSQRSCVIFRLFNPQLVQYSRNLKLLGQISQLRLAFHLQNHLVHMVQVLWPAVMRSEGIILMQPNCRHSCMTSLRNDTAQRPVLLQHQVLSDHNVLHQHVLLDLRIRCFGLDPFSIHSARFSLWILQRQRL
ncbi:hypothetical protein Mapa_008304 [Marchantia paleacea]|nr:hypothetical protein Mapa_008304 [Marchantia paleacea]